MAYKTLCIDIEQDGHAVPCPLGYLRGRYARMGPLGWNELRRHCDLRLGAIARTAEHATRIVQDLIDTEGASSGRDS